VKIFRRACFVLLVLFIASLIFAPGCIDSKPTPKPTPNPEPQPEPKPAGMSIVVLYDQADKSDLAPYADSVLDKYADSKGNALRVHPIDVVDETGKPPLYLIPFVTFAKDKKLPLVMIGTGGKVKGHLEQPKDAQAIIAYLDKSLGEVVPEDAFWAGGEWRRLGLPPLKPGADKRWTVEGSEANEPLIPADQWREIDLTPYIWGVKNQGSLSSCCPTSGDSVVEITSARSGLRKFTLSVQDAYSRINGGRDAGASLEDFTAIVTTEGVCTTDFAPEQGVRKPSYKTGYQVSRAKHRVLKATFCPDFNAIASALQRNKAVHFGLMVDSGFSPNSKGIIGPKRGRSGGGHAVVAVGMKRVDGEWYLIMLNSWGNWGGAKDGTVPNGCCLLHPSYIEPMFGAFAYSAVVAPSDDPIAQGKPAKVQPQPVFATAL
jgi:hypothetical protein